jgi:hypothetical protein
MRIPAMFLGLIVSWLVTVPEVSASSFHERVEAKPITKGGEIVGLRLTLTLRPSGSEKAVKIGLGGNYNNSGSYQTAASDPKAGYLLHQFPEIQVDGRTPKEVKLEVLYKDAPGLKPGSKVEVVSAWMGSHLHVWGMGRAGLTPTTIDLPRPAGATAPRTGNGASAARARASQLRQTSAARRSATARSATRQSAARQSARQSARGRARR